MLKQEGIIPQGSYSLFLDGKDTGKDVLVDTKTDVVTLNFYTLDTAFDSLLGGVDIAPARLRPSVAKPHISKAWKCS